MQRSPAVAAGVLIATYDKFGKARRAGQDRPCNLPAVYLRCALRIPAMYLNAVATPNSRAGLIQFKLTWNPWSATVMQAQM